MDKIIFSILLGGGVLVIINKVFNISGFFSNLFGGSNMRRDIGDSRDLIDREFERNKRYEDLNQRSRENNTELGKRADRIIAELETAIDVIRKYRAGK